MSSHSHSSCPKTGSKYVPLIKYKKPPIQYEQDEPEVAACPNDCVDPKKPYLGKPQDFECLLATPRGQLPEYWAPWCERSSPLIGPRPLPKDARCWFDKNGMWQIDPAQRPAYGRSVCDTYVQGDGLPTYYDNPTAGAWSIPGYSCY